MLLNKLYCCLSTFIVIKTISACSYGLRFLNRYCPCKFLSAYMREQLHKFYQLDIVIRTRTCESSLSCLPKSNFLGLRTLFFLPGARPLGTLNLGLPGPFPLPFGEDFWVTSKYFCSATVPVRAYKAYSKCFHLGRCSGHTLLLVGLVTETENFQINDRKQLTW